MPENLLNNEKDLLAQVSKGDEHAFRKLFSAYRGKLYSYVYKITESKETAEDTVHDVFLKLWLGREKLPEIQHLNAYLYRMAHNHVYNGLRRMAKKTLVMAELERQSGYETSDPDDKLVRKEVRQFINQAVNKLTPQQREVFQMSRELGLKPLLSEINKKTAFPPLKPLILLNWISKIKSRGYESNLFSSE